MNVRAVVARSLVALALASAAAAVAAQSCCDIVANPALRRLGRVVVTFPVEVSARVEVFRAGETKSLVDGYGDRAFDLFPGTYDVGISGKRVAGVTIRSGHDTQVKVGVLRVSSSDGTHVEIADPATNQRIADGYGTEAFGLPIGEVGVRIAGQTESVVIEAGQVTEF